MIFTLVAPPKYAELPVTSSPESSKKDKHKKSKEKHKTGREHKHKKEKVIIACADMPTLPTHRIWSALS